MNLSNKTSSTKLLLWFGSVIGILLVVIASLAIYISTRSDEWWSDILSTQLSQTLGREVEIQGKFHLDIGRTITIEVSSVRISNPAWSETPDMLRVGSLLLVFDPLSFFGDTLLIKRLDLADIKLELVQNQDGKKNWTFGAEPVPSSETPSAPEPDKGIALPVGIGQLSLQRARISLKQPSRKQPTVLQINVITGSTSANGKAVLDGSGQLNDLPLTLNAMLEPSETGFHLRPSKLVVGGYKVTAEGPVSIKKQFRAELNVTGEGPDLSVITRLATTIQLPAWPFQAKGKMAITPKDITLIDVSGTTGKHQVAVDGPIDFSGTMQLNVKASGPSLQAVLHGLGYDVIPASAPYEIETKVEIANNQLAVTAKQARLGPMKAVATLNIPDLDTPSSLKVDVRELKTNDISAALALVGAKLDLPKVMPANIIGQIERTEHTTRLSNVRGSIDTTNINVDGVIGDPPHYYNTRMNLDIRGSNLEHFLANPVGQAIPFEIKGAVLQDKQYTRFENLQLKISNIEARVHGQLGHWGSLEGTELVISAQAPDTDTLAAILHRSMPAGTVKFDGHVRTTKNAFHIDRMNAQLGRNNLSGDLKLIQGKPPLLKGRVNSTYLDFAMLHKEALEMGSNAKTKDTPSSDQTEAGKKNTSPEKQLMLLFSDTPIELAALDHIDLDLTIQVGEVTNSLKALGSLYDISAKVFLKGRDLSVSDFEVRGTRGGRVKGNLAMRSDAELTHLDVNIAGKQIRLGLGAAPGQDPATYPPTNIEAKFNGAGRTYHKLATSLNGRIKAVQGQGQVSNNQAVNMFSDTFSELFQTLNPFAKTEPTTRLNCAVYLINLANGKAELQDLVIQTDKLTILSAGIVDLNTEVIDINFETRSRKGLGISASTITNPYIRLGGTLKRPKIELDPERATIATGAAVLTGGLSFIYKGVWDRYFSSTDPCGEALARDAELQTKKVKQE
jgi:uncharacterized protein involved in outer membrane biogenesis